MLKKYRRNFVFLNVGAIGLTLMIIFIIVGINTYTNEYDELKSVMTMVLKPYNTQSLDTRTTAEKEPSQQGTKDKPKEHKPEESKQESTPQESISEESKQESTPQESRREPAEPRDNKSEQSPPAPRSGSDRQLRKNDNITTIFYNSGEGTYSVLSENISFSGDTDQVVNSIIMQKDSFGKISGLGVIYYKETTGTNYKIAVTDSSYITSRVVPVLLLHGLAFILAMLLVLFVSLKLSYIAAKPMEKAIEMERQFVADISHDLKTPITVILANNSILKSEPTAQICEQKQWIDSTDTAAKDMMNMINEMLTLSSLEAADKTVRTETVELSSLLQKCVLQMESVAYERGIIIESDIPNGLSVISSPDFAKRICSGLIDNALKYEPDGGRIEVRLQQSKKRVIMKVINAGSFIDQADLPHVFDRFYRGDKTRTTKKGHGLGLPIIKRMAELTGAHIRADSSRDSGTVFTVDFEGAV